MASRPDSTEAYVSLVTNNQYVHGAIVLGRSLRDTRTERKLCLMITEQVSEDMRGQLRNLWDEIVIIEELTSGDEESLELLQRPELGVTFSKIHAWRLIHYTKCVFLDADTMIVHNIDELFEREEFSAAPDIGWPDLFNSGVFVFQPSLDTFAALIDTAKTEGSYDGGDQGLLNTHWSDWSTSDSSHRLPFTYNVVASLTYSYPPAFKRFLNDIKVIHFLGSIKPWHHHYVPKEDTIVLHPSLDSKRYGSIEHIQRWWQIYMSTRQTTDSTTDLVIDESELVMTIEDEQSEDVPQPYVPTDEERRASWERGQPDVHGSDQSDRVIENIVAKLH